MMDWRECWLAFMLLMAAAVVYFNFAIIAAFFGFKPWPVKWFLWKFLK